MGRYFLRGKDVKDNVVILSIEKDGKKVNSFSLPEIDEFTSSFENFSELKKYFGREDLKSIFVLENRIGEAYVFQIIYKENSKITAMERIQDGKGNRSDVIKPTNDIFLTEALVFYKNLGDERFRNIALRSRYLPKLVKNYIQNEVENGEYNRAAIIAGANYYPIMREIVLLNSRYKKLHEFDIMINDLTGKNKDLEGTEEDLKEIEKLELERQEEFEDNYLDEYELVYGLDGLPSDDYQDTFTNQFRK